MCRVKFTSNVIDFYSIPSYGTNTLEGILGLSSVTSISPIYRKDQLRNLEVIGQDTEFFVRRYWGNFPRATIVLHIRLSCIIATLSSGRVVALVVAIVVGASSTTIPDAPAALRRWRPSAVEVRATAITIRVPVPAIWATVTIWVPPTTPSIRLLRWGVAATSRPYRSSVHRELDARASATLSLTDAS